MTKMNTIWVSTLMVLQWSLFKGSTGMRTCEPVSPFLSPYVTPIYEQYSVGAGCYCRAKTASSQEVHVINVKNSPETVNSEKPEMFLNIRPIAATGTYDKPLIFVLNSEQAVVWNIQGERLASVQHTLHVRRGSKVKYVGNMQAEVHKERRLPTDSKRLLEWTKEQYSVATSFTEIQRADHIYVRVGEESLLPPDCFLANNFFSPNTMAAYQEKQPASGCIVPPSGGPSQKKVHIVEVHSISKQVRENEIQNAIVNIASSEEEEQRVDVLVILKGPSGVNWQVSAEGVTGNLEILTNGNVNIVDIGNDELSIQQVRNSDGSLSSGVLLMLWATQRYKDRQLVSYTEAQVANMFNIQLRKTVIPDVDVEPPSLDLSNTKQIINYAMTVDCHSHGINIALKKDALDMFGIPGDSLSLEDRTCRASANATHYTLSTLLVGCNTQSLVQESEVIFTNALVITNAFTLEGSGMDSLDASATGEGPPSDDEDTQSFEVEFSCQYHTGRVEEDATIKESNGPSRVNDYTMEVFETGLYLNKHTHFPWIVGGNTAQIHVELGLKTDLEMFGVMPHNCWLSSSSDGPMGADSLILIEKGCHNSHLVVEDMSFSDLSDRFNMPSQNQLYRFSFYISSKQPQYLHCEITTCTRKKNMGLPLHLCLNQIERCIQLQAQPDIDHESPIILGHQTLGPIQLQDNSAPDIQTGKNNLKDDGRKTEEPPTGGSKQQQPINEIIIGLETGAVVGIAFAAFVIGVLLTAALWYIHTHTGPIAQKQPQQAAEQQQLQSTQHPQFGQLQGVTIGNGPTANGHVVHSYPYPSTMSTPMSALST